MDTPMTWARLRGDEGQLEALLRALDLPSGGEQVAACVALRAAARGSGDSWVDGQASKSSLEVALDLGQAEKRRRLDEEDRTRLRLQDAQVLQKPASWRSTAYRRAEQAGDSKAQQKAETRERQRWGRRVVEILVASGLPFGVEVKQKDWAHGSPEASRCLRGLRANTLKKRTSDLEPLLRFLQAELGKPFPTQTEDLLRYFRVREEEGAPRSIYSTTLSALSFFEEAGELAEGKRLANTPALKNSAKEFETRRAAQHSEEGRQQKRRQAPPMLVGVLSALERTVNDQDQPRFIRAYAWYRLFRHWASLRFDDTSGLSPQDLQIRARGVFGLLSRTKTSGSDKEITVLPVFVSFEAWVEKEWLRTGLGIWQSEGLGFSRDYFLCLPDRALTGSCGKRARYSDARGFSRSLLGTLRATDGSPLLLPAALNFWTEHSDRSGLDSWLGALSVGGDLRRFVGRWAAAGAEDKYVRSAVRITENCQRLAALHAQAVHRGGADHFGEEETLEQLRAFLGNSHHGTQEEIEDQIRKLTFADNSLAPDPLNSLNAEGRLDTLAGHCPPSCSETVVGPPPDPEPVDLPGVTGADIADMQVRQEKASRERTPAGFIISLTQGGRCRRLHFAGGCFRIPGEHYLQFEDLGRRHPGPHEFTHRCRNCFPAQLADQKVEDSEVDTDSDSSGSEGDGDSPVSATA